MLTGFWSHVEDYVSNKLAVGSYATVASPTASATDLATATSAATSPSAVASTAAALAPSDASSLISWHSESSCPCGQSQHKAAALLSYIYLRLSSTLAQPCINPELLDPRAYSAAPPRVPAPIIPMRQVAGDAVQARRAARAAASEEPSSSASKGSLRGAVSSAGVSSSAAGAEHGLSTSIAEALRYLFAAACRPLTELLHGWIEGREWGNIGSSSNMSGGISGWGEGPRPSLERRDDDSRDARKVNHWSGLQKGADVTGPDCDGLVPLQHLALLSRVRAPCLPVFLLPYRDLLERAALQWHLLSLSRHGAADSQPQRPLSGVPGGGSFAHLLLQSAWQEVKQEMMQSNEALVAANDSLPVSGSRQGDGTGTIPTGRPLDGRLCEGWSEAVGGGERGVWRRMDPVMMSFSAAQVRRVRDGSEQAVRRAAARVAECVRGAERMPASRGSSEENAAQQMRDLSMVTGEHLWATSGTEAGVRGDCSAGATGSGAMQQQQQQQQQQQEGRQGVSDAVQESKLDSNLPAADASGVINTVTIAGSGASASAKEEMQEGERKEEEEEGRGVGQLKGSRDERKGGTQPGVRSEGGGGGGVKVWRMEHGLSDVWDPQGCEEREVAAMLQWIAAEGDSESVQPRWTFRRDRGQGGREGEGLQGRKPASLHPAEPSGSGALGQQIVVDGDMKTTARQGSSGGEGMGGGRSAVAALPSPVHVPAGGHPCMVTSSDASVDDVISAYVQQPIISR